MPEAQCAAQGQGCEWAEVRTGRTEDRRDARTGHGVCLEVCLWLQPKISQGRVPGPVVAAARAEAGESILGGRRDAEGQRLALVVAAWSRVAGDDKEPRVGRAGRVSGAGGEAKAVGGAELGAAGGQEQFEGEGGHRAGV